MVPIRILAVAVETFSRHLGPPDSFLCFFTGNGEAVADTSRRVGGALVRKSTLKNRLNDALKRLQAAERGKDHRESLEVSSKVCSLVYNKT
jgi:hypothetical protein